MPSVDDPDEVDQYGVLEGLLFGPALQSFLSQVHPNHQLTRNCQRMMNDFICLMIRRIYSELKLKSLAFSKENIHTILPCIITLGEESCLLSYAEKEIDKDSNVEELDTFLPSYLLDKFPELIEQAASDEWPCGIKSCSHFVEYFCLELLELSGNASRDRHRYTIGVEHVCMAICSDKELDQLFRHVTFGQLSSSRFQIKFDIQDAIQMVDTVTNAEDDDGELLYRDDFVYNRASHFHSVMTSLHFWNCLLIITCQMLNICPVSSNMMLLCFIISPGLAHD